VAEAVELADAAQRANVVAYIGHEFRFSPENALGARLLAAGAVGAPGLGTFISYMPVGADPSAPRPAWWWDTSQGGGWLGTSGSHQIDHVRTWLGEFSTVHASLSVVSDRQNVAEDSFTVHGTMADGTTVVLQQTCGAWGAPTTFTRVAGRLGSVWVEKGSLWIGRADRSEPVEARRRHLPRGGRDLLERIHRHAQGDRADNAGPHRSG
jgi:predicted dehydrogenase